MTILLNRSGFDVTPVGTLKEAIEALPGKFDLLLIDLMLPDGSGAEVLQHVRTRGWPMWIGVITGVSDPNRLAALTPYSPQLVVRKPIDFQSLLSALNDPGN